jgi:lysophospholipase L1-like esterase
MANITVSSAIDNLLKSATATTARTALELGTAATLNSGTTTGSVPTIKSDGRVSTSGLSDNITVVLEGDSITAGVTDGGATSGNFLQDRLALESYFVSRSTFVNVATANNNIANIVSQYAAEVYPNRPSANAGKRAILLLNVGTNDSTASATQITNAATLLSYCATAITDGFEVWLCTLLPRSVTPNYWSYFNNALRLGENYSKLIDLNGLFSGTTIWTGDNLHPNNLGYRMISSYINGRAYDSEIRSGISRGSMALQDSDAVAITGGTFSGSTVTTTGVITRTSTGTSVATLGSQAIGAGSSRQWAIGHDSIANGNLPAGSFRYDYYNGTAWESALSGFSPFGGVVANQIRTVARTVSGLSSLSATIGNKGLVNDALVPAISSAVAAGGSKLCEVTYNGSSWIVTSILN